MSLQPRTSYRPETQIEKIWRKSSALGVLIALALGAVLVCFIIYVEVSGQFGEEWTEYVYGGLAISAGAVAAIGMLWTIPAGLGYMCLEMFRELRKK